MIRSLKTKFPANMALLFLAAFFSLTMSFSAFAERPYKTCSPKEVHPIWWEATMNRNIALTVSETNKTVRLDAGDEVTVTNFSRTGTNIIMLEDGTHCRVNRSEFTVTGDACTPGDYSKQTKINFVNSRRLVSRTKYMIWVSTDMQSLNVFTGSNRNWTMIKSYKCSTGMFGYETPIGTKTITDKVPVFHSVEWGSNLQYFVSFGGSGIHKWPGGGSVGSLGVEPCSHACVRLAGSAAKWIYKHIPIGTKLLVY